MNKQSLLAGIEKLVSPNVTKRFTLCMIDFDNFKEINDSCGHLVGDKVLQAFAGIARKHIRRCDQVGRFGGKEFVFIFMDANPQQSLRILQRIHNELNEYFKKFIRIPVTFSAGVVYVDAVGSLLECADLFLMLTGCYIRPKARAKAER
jgi:diguanylate cyclase (GGDEF)-like protein